MFLKKLKKIEYIIILLIFVIVFLFSYLIFIDKTPLYKISYIFERELTKKSIDCSKDVPQWMKNTINYILVNQGSLSNQLVYIDNNDKIHICNSGWKGGVFRSDRISENTRFRYASLTKLVTSDAVLQLVNQDKIQLNTPLLNFFPELKKENIKDLRIQLITIENLLEHRSGFDRMRSEDIVFSLKKKPWCPYNLKELKNLKLDFDPNRRYAYDNRNFCLLGAVLERKGKQSYRKYIQEHYLLNEKNIKFADGYYYPDEVKYDFRNNNFWMESDDNKFDFQALSSSAGLSGSAKQLAILIRKMLDSKPYNILSISDKSLSSCNLNEFKSCNGYAMWQYRQSLNQPVMYFRNGGLPAVTSLAIVTSKNEVVVWIGNSATLYDKNLLEKYFYKILNSD
ncbi:serine hydrolase [Acinetobacter sp. YH12045]|uniref:serine hydrolase domain-containing protein n=1 Tax=Acinetobacter sp. YH12045 TaxID=2601051 RepID=UPI0015D2B920|nr:serine hydrolase domain-containing protein [Acinetobacter sp. YH12045]